MFRLFFGFALALLFATSAKAESQNPFWGKTDKFLFVSETAFPGKSGTQTLCIHVTDRHLMYLPVHRVAGDYVLSETACRTDIGHPIPVDRIAMFKSAGILPADVPDHPALPLLWSIQNKGGILLAVFALISIPLLLRQRMRLASRRLLQKSGDPIFYDVLLTLLFHTARTDGVIDKAELHTIIRTYKDLTGTGVTPEMTAEKFAMALKDDAMIHLAKQYRGVEAKLLLDAAILVATSQGSIPREKLHFLKRLNEMLERDLSWFQQRLDAAMHPAAITNSPQPKSA